MKLKKSKCPVCGNKMTDTNGNLICIGCGYRISNRASSAGFDTAASASANPASQPRQTIIHYSYEQDHAASAAPPASLKTKIKNLHKKYKRLDLIATIVLIIVIAGLKLPVLFESLRENFNTPSNSGQTNQAEYPAVNNSVSSAKSSDNNKDAASSETNAVPLPESDMFRQFISSVFDKNYMEVTAEELAEITSLHIFDSENDYKAIAYTMQNGQGGTFYYDDVSTPTSDFVSFTGLECLYLERDSLDIGDLNGLDHLTSLRCGNSLAELSHIIDPSQLTILGIDADVFLGSLNGIEKFTNVTHLYLNGGFFLEDISALSSLKNLTALEITNGDSIESFKVLYDMPALEVLTIDSEKLRDVGFISNMPALKELSVQNSDIKKIDALADCKDTLTKLDLSYNYQVTDYDIVSSLSKLTDLTLFISYSFDEPSQLPDFSNMPGLTRLSIGNYDNFDQLVNAPGLQELTISDVYVYDLSALAGLTDLTCLNLFDMSCEPSALEPIMDLTQLERINLSDSYIWGNVEELLKLPNLKEFNINNCTAGFDMENLQVNERLEILQMNDVTLKALINGKWDYNAYDQNNMNLTEHTDMFRYYPNLKELYLAENELEDISFAENLSCLKVLDITDNYVTSLAPLTKLEQLEAVMCADNPIADDKGLEGKILTEN